MAQNETVLAGVLESFRHNPQKQFSVDQIERQAGCARHLERGTGWRADCQRPYDVE